jgi:hypothetical protein
MNAGLEDVDVGRALGVNPRLTADCPGYFTPINHHAGGKHVISTLSRLTGFARMLLQFHKTYLKITCHFGFSTSEVILITFNALR